MAGAMRHGSSEGTGDAAAAAAVAAGSSPSVNAVSLLLQEAAAQVSSEREKSVDLCKRALEIASAAAAAGDSRSSAGGETNGSKAGEEHSLPSREEALRLYEQGLAWLAGVYAEAGDTAGVCALLESSHDLLRQLPKARTAKLVRLLVGAVAAVPTAQEALEAVCESGIAWCIREKRAFLRTRIELRLAQAYLSGGKLQQAQQLLSRLLLELKKLDDKLLLVEAHLLDSELNFKLKNFPKSRAALTAARTNANSIHCPPTLQGQLDLQAGVLHAHDRDYKTAFSYFFEAFEAFSAQEAAQNALRKHQQNKMGERPIAGKGSHVMHRVMALQAYPPAGWDAMAVADLLASPACVEECCGVLLTLVGVSGDDRALALQSLKYMLLAKILMGRPQDVPVILSGKQGLRYYHQPGLPSASAAHVDASVVASTEVSADVQGLEALRLLSICRKESSLKMFGALLESHGKELEGDPVLQQHIEELYETLLEKDLSKTLQAFSRVELSHVARLIGLPEQKVEEKLCEMMLDGKLHGTLDQGVGVLVLFDTQQTPKLYTDVLGTVANMAAVVDALYDKAQQTL
ncbi:PCI domain-containing protein [Cyclospora cayetanensis]|uniref:PCI domain-containing protein n=1 Tax=Cyclospora cayetanensis TaxID=88456 RepID=A0A1D3CU65_9EIME|nr:PCI domain-containing protein [Cyclospora cayetanensis]